jgi:hypothetical protein
MKAIGDSHLSFPSGALRTKSGTNQRNVLVEMAGGHAGRNQSILMAKMKLPPGVPGGHNRLDCSDIVAAGSRGLAGGRNVSSGTTGRVLSGEFPLIYAAGPGGDGRRTYGSQSVFFDGQDGNSL